jgi:hypothetical protein
MIPTQNMTDANAAQAQWASKADIALGIIADDEQRPDGMSHRERVALVLTRFGAETIDFDERYDYGVALMSCDPYTAEAWRQLAILQSVYVELCYAFQWISDEQFYTLDDYLKCVIRNIDWHIYCLYRGEYKALHVIPDRDLYDGPDKPFL